MCPLSDAATIWYNSPMRKLAIVSAAVAMSVFGGTERADPSVTDQASRAGKGILVLQIGSDWCVSGDDVRQAFESDAFKRTVGSKYVLAVFDDMDKPDAEPKEILLEKADVIISNLSGTYQNDKGEMSVSAKVGISLFPLDGQSYEELYESAIKALYYSKHSVTNGATFAFEGTKPALPIQGTM